MRHTYLPIVAAALALAGLARSADAAIGQPAIVSFTPSAGAVVLVQETRAAPLFVDGRDWPGVIRAATDLQADVERVTHLRPRTTQSSPQQAHDEWSRYGKGDWGCTTQRASGS